MPAKSKAQQRLMAAAEHGATFPKAKAVRAVGAAVGRNPITIIVPCHRILGASGQLTGYAGGLWRKEALLRLEGHPLATTTPTTSSLFSE